MNSLVLVKIRERWGAKHLWARLIGSTLVGLALHDRFATSSWNGICELHRRSYVCKVGIEVPTHYLPRDCVVRRVEHLKSDLSPGMSASSNWLSKLAQFTDLPHIGSRRGFDCRTP